MKQNGVVCQPGPALSKMHVDVMVQFMNPKLRIFGLNILIFITSIFIFNWVWVC